MPACSNKSETVEHLLLRCPNYAYERWEMDQHTKKSCKPLTLETPLGCPKMAVPLAKYIKATGRFQQNSQRKRRSTPVRASHPQPRIISPCPLLPFFPRNVAARARPVQTPANTLKSPGETRMTTSITVIWHAYSCPPAHRSYVVYR